MGSESINDICILLVATELPFIRKTLDLLLKANYRVVFNCKGDDALSRLKTGKRKVDLVLTETNLPDMCGFMFIQIVDTEFKLPVVMISETYDEPTFLRGLLNGAMYCLAKPLCEEDIKDLWRYPILKGRDVNGKSSEFSKSGVTDKELGINVVKDLDMAKEPCEFEDSCDGLPSNFIWTSHDLTRFLEIIFELGIHNANAMEILRRIDIPGLTTHIAVVKLQEFRLYLKRQGVLPSKTNSCFHNPLFISNHQQPYGGFQYMGTNEIIRNQKLLIMGFLQNPPNLDEDDEEMSFFDWLKDYGVYADPFPRFCDAMSSSTTLLGSVPPITYVLQKMLEPRANSPQSCMQPNLSTAVTEVPPAAAFGGQENGHVVQGLPALPSLCQSSYPSDLEPLELGESVGSSVDESLAEIPKGASD